VVAALALGAVAPASASACTGADLIPNAANVAQARAAMICLINAERARHGLVALVPNTALTNAAQGHSNDMAVHHFFSHGDVFGRIKRSGYFTGATRFAFGETLVFNCGAAAGVSAIVAQLLASSLHSSRLLNPTFRHIGVGPVAWSPNGCVPSATYTLNFGFKS
jgi:uncharacterized protein YkwD